jgi:hypothetical protein
MYLVYVIDQIHHLMNEPKKLIFAYNSDQREQYSILINHCPVTTINIHYTLTYYFIHFFFQKKKLCIIQFIISTKKCIAKPI